MSERPTQPATTNGDSDRDSDMQSIQSQLTQLRLQPGSSGVTAAAAAASLSHTARVSDHSSPASSRSSNGMSLWRQPVTAPRGGRYGSGSGSDCGSWRAVGVAPRAGAAVSSSSSLAPSSYPYSPSSFSPSSSPMCRNYASTRQCRFGDRCRFIHDGKSFSSSAARSPLPSSAGSYVSSSLRSSDAQRFRAAGIFPFRRIWQTQGDGPNAADTVTNTQTNANGQMDKTPTKQSQSQRPSRIEVLFGVELHRDASRHGCLVLMGGKREAMDQDSAHTAAREVYEESGGVIVASTDHNNAAHTDGDASIQHLRAQLLQTASPSSHSTDTCVLWYAPKSFVLYMWEMDQTNSEAEGIVKRFQQRRQQLKDAMQDSHSHGSHSSASSSVRSAAAPLDSATSSRRSEIVSLHWVDLRVLLNFLDANPNPITDPDSAAASANNHASPSSNDIDQATTLLQTTDGKSFHVPPFVTDELNVPQMKEWIRRMVRQTTEGAALIDSPSSAPSSMPPTPRRTHTIASPSSFRTPPPSRSFRSAASAGFGSSGSSGRDGRATPKTPADMTRKPYMAPSLLASDARAYRAAGVLAYRAAPMKSPSGSDELVWQVLVGREGPAANDKMRGRLNLLGGKIDEADRDGTSEEAYAYGPATTAARECWEESGGTIADHWMDIRKRLTQHMSMTTSTTGSLPSSSSSSSSTALHSPHSALQPQVLWYPNAKYALHFLALRGPRQCSVVESYATALANSRTPSKLNASHPSAELHKDMSEMDELHWVELSELIRYLARNIRRRPHASPNAPGEGSPLRTIDGRSFPTVGFMVAMLNTPPMQHTLHQLMNIQPTVESATLAESSNITA